MDGIFLQSMGNFELIGNVLVYVIVLGLPLFFLGRAINRKIKNNKKRKF